MKAITLKSWRFFIQISENSVYLETRRRATKPQSKKTLLPSRPKCLLELRPLKLTIFVLPGRLGFSAQTIADCIIYCISYLIALCMEMKAQFLYPSVLQSLISKPTSSVPVCNNARFNAGVKSILKNASAKRKKLILIVLQGVALESTITKWRR